MSFIVARDADDLARRAADAFCAHAADAIARRDRFAVALAGGSTPATAYRALSTAPFVDRVDWERVHVFFGDERCVPPDHEQSNFRMAREALLDHVPIPPQQVHRIEGERDDLGVVAREYADTLRSVLGPGSPDATPRLDLALLGLGEDGHTASIFPDVISLCRGPELAARVRPASQPTWRVTLTLPVLTAARHVLFLVSGEPKRDVVARLRSTPPSDDLPASLVRPSGGTLTFLLDQTANGG